MWGWNLHPVSEVRSIDGTVTDGRRCGGGIYTPFLKSDL